MSARRIQLLLRAVAIMIIAPVSICTQPVFPEPGHVYDDTRIPAVFVDIHPDTLVLIETNIHSDTEYRARFIFANGISVPDTVYQVGFRLRGNTSRESQKKSFKISFNTFERGRKYHGIEKMNLNGEHNDPSIIRAKLAWDLFRKMGVPAPRANHVQLYVNGLYRGLYINVEHIDEEFTDSRFRTNDGNLYKCLYPADLTYLGDDPEAYKFVSGGRRAYELKTNEDLDDYSDLRDLIRFINLSSESEFANGIEDMFNVDSFLKVLAMDVATGSWDDYWYLKNNFYLYRDSATDRFEWIPYDYDNSFGIDWIGRDWGRRDVYNWGHESEARPLAERILQVPAYRDRYTYYLDRILGELMDPAVFFPRIDEIYQDIRPSALIDTYKGLDWGFTNDDFTNSYDVATAQGHVAYGLKEFVQVRRQSALAQTPVVDIQPILRFPAINPVALQPNLPFSVSIEVEDDHPGLVVLLAYSKNGGVSVLRPMNDNAMDGDALAGDGRYTATVPAAPSAGSVSLFVEVTDSRGAVRIWPKEAPTLPLVLAVGTTPVLRINEFMASNETTIKDEADQFEDWVEVYNPGPASVSLDGIYLTDNLANPDKWAFPAISMGSGEFVLVWVDDDVTQGNLHAPFKLSKGGEQVGLFYAVDNSYAVVDSVSFGEQITDVSTGRYPDGAGPFSLMTCGPTPGFANCLVVRTEDGTLPAETDLSAAWPNPFNTGTNVELTLHHPAEVLLTVYDVLGRQVFAANPVSLQPGKHHLKWDGRDETGVSTPSGMYFIRLNMTGHKGKQYLPVALPVTKLTGR